MKTKEFTIPSTDGVHQLYTKMWYPIGKPIGIVQLNHGMCDYINRYDRFAYYLAKHNFVVIGHDHIGHGNTALNRDDLGKFIPVNSGEVLVEDMYTITKFVKAHYPDLPIVIQGHSMGSIILRKYLIEHGDEVDGAVVMATSYTTKNENNFNLMMLNNFQIVFGKHRRSQIASRIVSYIHNHQFAEDRIENAWISSDMNEVITNNYDPMCAYNFTLNGYHTIVRLQKEIEDEALIQKMPKNLPLLLASGEKDTLGGNGEGIKKLAEKYRQLGMENVTMMIFENGRHDLLHEKDYMTVYKSIEAWIKEVIDR
ncbi:Lysophospholipase, alpha-beta hydrolase superfamily [Granulicatella balaenopterae]|uniref:Lysophospholipase, alpha-beta hydrolase superfamily n=1 Tax=Granulicatella balaenopterae TaxID=137733 RepID=A0A1H9MSX5_9LACT|nr:alpha/beta hydrolase [Granulicatella balaenopterae]SER26810.1 Lysophospholipase, alpha-beta hydrolase superfamily [Granulicatella balaenopterae]